MHANVLRIEVSVSESAFVCVSNKKFAISCLRSTTVPLPLAHWFAFSFVITIAICLHFYPHEDSFACISFSCAIANSSENEIDALIV